MPYTPTNWVEGVTTLGPTNMNKIESELAFLDARIPAAALSYGTTLPGSPVDGQEAILVDSTANPSYQWRFRYNAGSGSAYKWEFVGGPPLQVEIDTMDGTPSATYVTLGTPGPLVTLARGGDYLFSFGCNVQNNAAQANLGFMSLKVGAAVATDADSASSMSMAALAGANGGTITRSRRKTGIAASTTIEAQYHNSGFSSFFFYRWLNVLPIRVS